MASVAQHGSVRTIRPGLKIPEQRKEDLTVRATARLAASYQQQAYELAQTRPDSEDHRLALQMAGIGQELPRNNLRVIVTPVTPPREWFDEACRKWRVAKAVHDLAESRYGLAYCLDQQDRGDRCKAAKAERDRAQAELNLATVDALRTPTVRKADALRKQEMVGKRAWAAIYRPDWQGIIDEDLARFPPRQPRKQGSR